MNGEETAVLAARQTDLMDGLCQGLWGECFVDALTLYGPIPAIFYQVIERHLWWLGCSAGDGPVVDYLVEREHVSWHWLMARLIDSRGAPECDAITTESVRRAYRHYDLQWLIDGCLRYAPRAVPQAT